MWRSFRFWVALYAALWLAGFILLFLWLSFAFDDTNPDSSTFDGMTTEALTEIRVTLLEIYLPYIGVILGGAVALHRKRRPYPPLRSLLLPGIVLLLGLFFNFYFFISFWHFVHNQSAEYQPLLQDLRVFAAALAVFMASALSYFFDLGFASECEPIDEKTDAPSQEFVAPAPDDPTS